MPEPILLESIDPTVHVAQVAMRAYFDELDAQIPGGFDAAHAAGEAKKDAHTLAAPDGVFVIGIDGLDPVACGGLRKFDDTTGEIKRMWVHHDHRGRGLGGQVLDRLEHEAYHLGYRRIVLDTNATLTDAIGMYQRRGYNAIERYNDNPYAQAWFSKDL